MDRRAARSVEEGQFKTLSRISRNFLRPWLNLARRSCDYPVEPKRGSEEAMKRSWNAAAAMVLGSLALVACGENPPKASEPSGSAAAQTSGLEGRIVFMRGDPSEGVLAGEGVTYTVNADGSGERQLFPDGDSPGPGWSPDGSQIAIFCCDNGMAAHLLDPERGLAKWLAASTPAGDEAVSSWKPSALSSRRNASSTSHWSSAMSTRGSL